MGYVNKTYLSTQFKNFADKIAKVFSKIGHTHLKSDITDFPTSMPANGGNAATVGGHTVGVNVPSNAKFTDTTYSKLSEFTDDIGYVKNTDARLTNARPASDVYAWAKASIKPTYTASEVGLGNVDNTADSAKSVKYATSAGSASSALKATGVVDYGSPANTIQIGYGGAGISGDAIKYIAGYTAGNGSDVDARIKDVSKDALKSWLGLGSLAYSSATIPTIPSSLPANGGNSATVNGHTVNSDVPANAKFTDTTYGVATSSALGLVKSGTDITVDSSGNVSVNDDSHSHTQIKYCADLLSNDAINNFIEAKTFKTAVWGNTGSPGVTNGIILSGGYTSNTYGYQLAIDDDPTYYMALRQKNGNGWSPWKRIPMGDGTGASGTWNINISGNATTATSADSVAWENVSGKPSTFTPASHTHNYAGSSSAGGAANSAVSVLDYNDTSRTIKIGYAGAGATTSNLAFIAGYLSSGTQIKDVSKDTLKSWLGLGSAAYTNSGDYATASHTHTKSQITDFPTSLPANGGTSSYTNMINGTYTGNGGAQPPSYIKSGKVRFNMMNAFEGLSNLPTYADCILMDTYGGSDVPYVTGLGIVKASGNPRAFIAVGAKGNTTTWASQTELITKANIGSQSVSNADTVDGFHASDFATASHTHDYVPLSGNSTVNGAITFGKSDNYGIRTNTNNYGRIGDSTNQFYEVYANTIYENKIKLSEKYAGKSAATQSAQGLMSAADKKKLDSIEEGATARTGALTIYKREKDSTLEVIFTGKVDKTISFNNWEIGTTSGTVCAGNDSRLSDARPASDVYAWAKASTPDGIFEGGTYKGNIDSYTESTLRPGKSYYISTTNISSSSALPFSGYGILTSYAVGSAVVQQIFRYNGSSKIIDAIYTRMYINNGWTSWSRVALTKV